MTRRPDSPSVLVVEDDAIIAGEVRRVLTDAGYEIAAVVSSGLEALAEVRHRRPNLILMDIDLGGDLDGVEVAERVMAQCPTRIIYLTGFSDPKTLQRAAGTNPYSYLVKPFGAVQLRTAVAVALSQPDRLASTTVRGGASQKALEEIARVLRTSGYGTATEEPWELEAEAAGLSGRELEVMRHLVTGARVGSLARTLGIAEHTVRNHLKVVFRKLGVHSQTELIEWATTRRE